MDELMDGKLVARSKRRIVVGHARSPGLGQKITEILTIDADLSSTDHGGPHIDCILSDSFKISLFSVVNLHLVLTGSPIQVIAK
jgi:hypothetical protein